MKKIISLILTLSAFFACEKAVVNITDEPQLKVANEIVDVTVEEGEIITVINIKNVFRVYNADNAIITTSLYSNQNTALVSTNVMGDTLYLSVNIGQMGSSEITLRAEFGRQVVYDSFVFTVDETTVSAAMNDAIQLFQNSDYESAANYFKVVISKNTAQYQSDAYMGLGFSQMRNDNAPDAYLSLQSSISENGSNSDTKAGLSLMEYAYTKNYSEAIRIGQEILTTNSSFIFRYDSNLDFNDILVNIALSQYSSLLYDDCLFTIQQIDPAFILSVSDPDYKTKMYQKLQELITLYG
jgi:hypothetical protein